MKLEHRLMNAYYTPYFCILNNVHNKNVFKILRILYRSWPSDIYPRPERLVQHLKINVMRVKFAQSCPTLGNPIDYAVHGILQARILEWVAIPFPRGPSWPRDWTQVSWIAGRFFTVWAIPVLYFSICFLLLLRIMFFMINGCGRQNSKVPPSQSFPLGHDDIMLPDKATLWI